MKKKYEVPKSYQRLIDVHEEPILCTHCESKKTYGDWDTDISYDDGEPHLMSQGEAYCIDCGRGWKL